MIRFVSLKSALCLVALTAFLASCSANPGKSHDEGSGAFSDADASLDLESINRRARAKGAVQSSWHCANQWEKGPHSVELDHFEPRYGPGYKLQLRPRQRHCRTDVYEISISVNGNQHKIKCQGEDRLCNGSSFVVPVSSKRTWTIAPAELAAIAKEGEGSFGIHYKQLSSEDSRCGSDQNSFGIALALSYSDSEEALGQEPGSCSGFDLN